MNISYDYVSFVKQLLTFAPVRIARGMPSSGSSGFDFDVFILLGFTNELRIFSAFLHSSEADGSFVSLNRHGGHMKWGTHCTARKALGY